MKTKHLFLLSFLLLLFSCEIFDIDGGPDVEYKKGRLLHDGFDFSQGITDTVKWENNDGDVVNWSPVNPQKRNKLWYRPGFGITPELPADNSQKNMGSLPLDSIKTIPSKFDPDPDPLIIGNSYVVKCLDGYAKFKVLDLGNNNDWWADIEFEFTTENKFE